jgi:hypothetical protein
MHTYVQTGRVDLLNNFAMPGITKTTTDDLGTARYELKKEVTLGDNNDGVRSGSHLALQLSRNPSTDWECIHQVVVVEKLEYRE